MRQSLWDSFCFHFSLFSFLFSGDKDLIAGTAMEQRLAVRREYKKTKGCVKKAPGCRLVDDEAMERSSLPVFSELRFRFVRR